MRDGLVISISLLYSLVNWIIVMQALLDPYVFTCAEVRLVLLHYPIFEQFDSINSLLFVWKRDYHH